MNQPNKIKLPSIKTRKGTKSKPSIPHEDKRKKKDRDKPVNTPDDL